LIAGGGVAGLEALHGLHVMAAARVALTLVAPPDRFRVPARGGPRSRSASGARGRSPITAGGERRGAKLVAGTLGSVDADAKVVTTTGATRSNTTRC